MSETKDDLIRKIHELKSDLPPIIQHVEWATITEEFEWFSTKKWKTELEIDELTKRLETIFQAEFAEREGKTP